MSYIYNEHDENQVKKILKQRKKKKLKNKVKVFIGVVVFGFIFWFMMSDYPKVKSIHISGNINISENQILDNISINTHSFYWFMNTNKIEKEIKDNLAIKSAEVKCDLLGNVNIEVQEAEAIAFATINEETYEINDMGEVIEVTDQERKEELYRLVSVNHFSSLDMLKEFAQGYQSVSNLTKNEMSDIYLAPRSADPTLLKCLLKNNYIIYIRIEDLADKLNEKSFDLEAYKVKYPTKHIYSFEGNNIYLLDEEK